MIDGVLYISYDGMLEPLGQSQVSAYLNRLAAGTPLVSTDCPSGRHEILSDGQFGRLVPVGNAATLASAIGESLATTHDRAALMARAQDFSIDKAMDRYEELLFPEHDRLEKVGRTYE